MIDCLDLLLEGEIWKDIPGYEGFYQASNFGRIKSLSRSHYNKGKNCYVKKQDRILRQVDTQGYLRVPMQKSPQSKKKESVHRMVASAFLGVSHLTVDHIDSNKKNNNISNLRYVSYRENIVKYFNENKKQGVPGVIWCNKRMAYRVRISVNKREYHLGYYSELDSAIAARKTGETKYDFYKEPTEPHPHTKRMKI